MEIFSRRTVEGKARRSFHRAGGVLLILFAGGGVVGRNGAAADVPVLQSVAG